MPLFRHTFCAFLFVLGLTPTALSQTPNCSIDEQLNFKLPYITPERREQRPLAGYSRQLIRYAIELMTKRGDLDIRDDHQLQQSHLSIPCKDFFASSLSLARSAANQESYLTLITFLRKNLFDKPLYYDLARRHFSNNKIPPQSWQFLQQLKPDSQAASHLSHWNLSQLGWQQSLRSPSQAKARARIIYRSPQDFKPQMSIALTVDSMFYSENSDFDPRILEVEIIIKPTRPRPETTNQAPPTNWRFLTYDHQGQLTNCSSFFSGTKILITPVPYTCLSCHYNKFKGFTQNPGSYGGWSNEYDWDNIDVDELPEENHCNLGN